MNKKIRTTQKTIRKFIKEMKTNEEGYVVDELSNPKYDLPIVALSKDVPNVPNWIPRYLMIPYKKVAEIYDSDGYEGLQDDGWSIPNDWGYS